MRKFIFCLSVLAMVGCSNGSGKGNGGDNSVRKGSDTECTNLWGEVDYYESIADQMTIEEKRAACKDVQGRYLGISCERTSTTTDEQGNTTTVIEEISVNGSFCSGL